MWIGAHRVRKQCCGPESGSDHKNSLNKKEIKKFTFFKNPTNSIVLENNSASAALHSTKNPPVYVFLPKEYRKRVVKVNQIELQDFAIFAGSL